MDVPKSSIAVDGRPVDRRILVGFTAAAVIGIISQFMRVERPVEGTLHAVFNVLGLAIMLFTAEYGLRKMREVRGFRWIILGGIAGMTIHEFLYQLRYIPYVKDVTFGSVNMVRLGEMAGRVTPAIAAMIGLGFMLALYQLERSRVQISREHQAVCEQTALRVRAESEQRELASRVHELEKTESLIEMASGVAHELSNLFTVVTGNTGLLLESNDLGYTERANLEAIERAATKGGELAAKMRAYAGASRARQSIGNLSMLVAGMLKEFETAKPQNVELCANLSDDVPTALLDEVGIRQALGCLFSNAVEAIGGEPGRVTISTGTKSVHGMYDVEQGRIPHLIQYVYVEVKDTGCGMEQNTERRALDPFYSTKFLGRGLGLAIVQGVARSHDGHVEIESAPTAGSVFRILIPHCDVATIISNGAKMAPAESTPHGDAFGRQSLD